MIVVTPSIEEIAEADAVVTKDLIALLRGGGSHVPFVVLSAVAMAAHSSASAMLDDAVVNVPSAAEADLTASVDAVLVDVVAVDAFKHLANHSSY